MGLKLFDFLGFIAATAAFFYFFPVHLECIWRRNHLCLGRINWNFIIKVFHSYHPFVFVYHYLMKKNTSCSGSSPISFALLFQLLSRYRQWLRSKLPVLQSGEPNTIRDTIKQHTRFLYTNNSSEAHQSSV